MSTSFLKPFRPFGNRSAPRIREPESAGLDYPSDGYSGPAIVRTGKFRRLAIFAFGVVAISSIPLRAVADGEAQAESLVSRMTLDEKIGQMVQVDLGALKDKEDIRKYFLGSMLSGGNSDPSDNLPATWLQTVHEFEALALKTRLGIPLIYGIDAVHGHNNIDGAVIFPHNIGMGATRDPKLAGEEARVTAEEIAGTGIHWAFGPCIAVAQDIRWGRTYESFSDSPDLVSELGAAEVRGFQTPVANGFTVMACAKHFLADGGTQNGTDQGNTVCDEATLRRLFLAPYRAVNEAGAKSIMVSYSSWNGAKMHGNKHLLTDVLKGELGFNGFLVSDWAAIDQLSPDYKNDIKKAVNAGLDMFMIPNGPGQPNNYIEFIGDLKGLVASGQVPQSRIDDAVRRILRAKVEIGLFEHPYADPDLLSTIGSSEHRQVARQCVRESLVLLKNEHNALPLAKNIKHLMVIGKAADDLGMQCGGWTISWQGDSGPVTHGGTTLLAAIRQAVSSGTEVTYSADGASPAGADAIIAVVGEMPYAEMKGDRTNLSLSPADAAMITRARAAGVPVVTVLYSGRPLVLGQALDQSDAFLAAWLPGTEGEGVADVLFGDSKPTGKLPRPWPRDNSQLTSSVPGAEAGQPLLPFGFGLTCVTPEAPANLKMADTR